MVTCNYSKCFTIWALESRKCAQVSTCDAVSTYNSKICSNLIIEIYKFSPMKTVISENEISAFKPREYARHISQNQYSSDGK